MTRFVIWGAKLPSVVEVMDDEMPSTEKRKPLALGDGPFWVDGKERRPGGVVDEGEEGIRPFDDELPLSDKGLLEPEGELALLVPSEREELPGESVEGD